MASGEFDLIARHLTALGVQRPDVVLGVGDDAAILDLHPSRGLRSAAACISLAELTRETIKQSIGASIHHLAAQLNDDGFEPAWVTLALTLPRPDDRLVKSIADAVHGACMPLKLAVVGGDTTAGEASLTIFMLATHN